jgi:1-deoxy-D-xylulose-5-phosphate synthase
LLGITVFNSPHDKIVFDVSHQSYTHKILTGRKLAWLDPDHYHDVSGFTEPRESEHDFFTIGHTSTSVGLASGLALARDDQHTHDHITAVIGDGSMSGGLAYEALDNAAVLNRQLLIVVNDNQWSIAENHGGIYQNLG